MIHLIQKVSNLPNRVSSLTLQSFGSANVEAATNRFKSFVGHYRTHPLSNPVRITIHPLHCQLPKLSTAFCLALGLPSLAARLPVVSLIREPHDSKEDLNGEIGFKLILCEFPLLKLGSPRFDPHIVKTMDVGVDGLFDTLLVSLAGVLDDLLVYLIVKKQSKFRRGLTEMRHIQI